MRSRAGAVVASIACLLFLVVLGWPFAVQSPSQINTYYQRGVLTPLLAGGLAVGVLVTFAATHEDVISTELGAGIALVLGLSAALVSVAWAVTARVDVFRAPGWALPAQRFVLVGLASLVLLGAGWHAWTNALRSSDG